MGLYCPGRAVLATFGHEGAEKDILEDQPVLPGAQGSSSLLINGLY